MAGSHSLALGRRSAVQAAAGLALGAGRSAVAQGAASYPLRIAAGARRLEDARGRPFLLHGDTAWSLIVQLRLEEAEEYLRDRHSRGFNTILVNLIEHRYATRAPANIYGSPPFRRPGAFGEPNEAYFAHADRVLDRATAHGFLVLLAPAYLGYQGEAEGWYRTMMAAGERALLAYGDYVGRRYGHLANVMWVHGGDFSPPERRPVRAVADGIRRHARHSLHTAHCSPEMAAAEHWGGEPWLDVDNLYTYRSVSVAAAKARDRRPRRPFFLMESAYEHEHGADDVRLRTQAYQALLGGTCGQVFGNNPIWHFGTPGARDAPVTWREALAGSGTRSMEMLLRLFSSIPWWLLEPDGDGSFSGAASGAGSAQQSAAITRDGRLALVHLPSGQAVTVDLSRMAGPRVVARWFDPSAGSYTPAGEALATTAGRLRLLPPGRNRAGQQDWILEVTSHAA